MLPFAQGELMSTFALATIPFMSQQDQFDIPSELKKATLTLVLPELEPEPEPPAFAGGLEALIEGVMMLESWLVMLLLMVEGLAKVSLLKDPSLDLWMRQSLMVETCCFPEWLTSRFRRLFSLEISCKFVRVHLSMLANRR